MGGEATGAVRVALRVEGLCVLIAATAAYSTQGLGWGTFALFLFAPDVSFLGYLAGPNVGAVAYNLVHTYAGPIVCLAAGYFLSIPALIGAGLIWSAHIGMDRTLGYGLKYPDGFEFMHLGRLKRQK
jgi:hypothetical protein